MPALIAVAYQDETTAAVAGEEVVRLSAHLEVLPEDVAVIMVEPGGTYRTTTRVSPSGHTARSAFWMALFGALVFEPAGTAGSEALLAVAEEGVDVRLGPGFTGEVRRLLTPGASALFVLVESGDADLVLEALERYGGRPLRASWGRGVPGSAA